MIKQEMCAVLYSKLRRIFVFFMILSLTSTAFAQNSELVDETKNDIMIVMGGGLAGAVLGLSTLSFVDKPNKHTKNILVGASLGIIAGVAYVAFNQANKSRGYFEDEDYSYRPTPSFETMERSNWHQEEFINKVSEVQNISFTNVNYQFNF